MWGKARRQQLLRVIIRRPSVSVVHRCRQVSLENIRLNRVWITMAIQGLISLSCGQPLVRVKPIHDVQWQVKSLFWLGSVWALQFICPAEWLKSHSGLYSAAWDSLRADGSPCGLGQMGGLHGSCKAYPSHQILIEGGPNSILENKQASPC